ncbi:MAG: nuclear transport factor 2 family protein [Acidimicrobiales bacterium]
MDDEVRRLIDSTQIRELTARYNRCFDDGDAEGFADTFVEDGVMEVTGAFTVSGRQALAGMCRHTPYGVVHMTVDATVAVDGDRAVQDVTVLVVNRPKPDAGPDERRSTLERTGRYHDDVVRTADGWRFARRRVTLDGGV